MVIFCGKMKKILKKRQDESFSLTKNYVIMMLQLGYNIFRYGVESPHRMVDTYC